MTSSMCSGKPANGNHSTPFGMIQEGVRRHGSLGSPSPLSSFAIQKESRMDYQIEDAVEILRRTPATLAALLRGLPAVWTKSTAGPDTWSAYDVVGHLLHGDET